eukprot:TRINITY_DN27550_c0_g3_i1.p1 TRINITY_DN27550_c0_g3~~TRINITY_DN27550_c0_g3_i1.p1  ORF type:complete len:462 (+),score=80.09 TRINITY_DN27550_c0_g3_i1:71-1387(+)
MKAVAGALRGGSVVGSSQRFRREVAAIEKSLVAIPHVPAARPFASWVDQHREQTREARQLIKKNGNPLSGRQERLRDGSQHADWDERSEQQRHLVGQVSHLGRIKQWEEALAVFESVHDPSKILRSAVVGACAKNAQLEHAFRLFHEIPEKQVSTYNILIWSLSKARRITEAQALLEDMRSSCLAPTASTYGALMGMYAAMDQPQGVVKTVNEMEAAGFPLTQVACNNAISACSRSGAKDMASQLLERMLAAGIQPRIEHFTGVVMACAKDKDEARAREVFATLGAHNVRPDVVIFTALLHCIAGPDSLQRCKGVLEEMRREGIEPNSFTFNAVLKAATECRSSKDFYELLEQMEERGLARTYETQERIRQFERMMQQYPAEVASVDVSAVPIASASAPATPPPLPVGWHEASDPNSGRSYYWNASNPGGTTTWDRPA